VAKVVFSGTGRISMKSHCLDHQLLSDCLRYYYKYDWLRPKLEEIVAAYSRIYCNVIQTTSQTGLMEPEG
jgi:hypothetical protein